MVKCYVSITYNPNFKSGYEISSITDDDCKMRQLRVRILINDVKDLNKIAKLLSDQFVAKHFYDVRFKWNCVPKKIRNDPEFKDIIYRVFSTNSIGMKNKLITVKLTARDAKTGKEVSKQTELDKYVDLIRNHMSKHGAHPDFQNVDSEKGRRKIVNFLRSVCNNPNLSEESAVYLAKKINIVKD